LQYRHQAAVASEHVTDCIIDNRGPAGMLIESRCARFARQAGQTYLNPC
jgi:hypothetical protein